VLHESDDFNMLSSWKVYLILAKISRGFRIQVVLADADGKETPFLHDRSRPAEQLIAAIQGTDNWGLPFLRRRDISGDGQEVRKLDPWLANDLRRALREW